MKKTTKENKVDLNKIKDFFVATGKDIKEKFQSLVKEEDNKKKLIVGGAVLAVLIVLLVAIKGCGHEYYSASGDIEAFKVDKVQEIDTLMEQYYAAYSLADIEALEAIATPMSDLEKGYITLLAGYVEEYQDISCYTKSGLEDGSYFVCVSMAMKFYGVDTPAPGVETFYVRTDENGNYYIDNTYSTFNLQTQEYPLDSTMAERITAFESEADVVELCSSVTSAYATAVENDSSLDLLISSTLPTAIGNWMTSAVAEQEAAEAAAAEAQASADAAAAEEAAQAAAAEQAAEEAAAAEAEAAQAAAEEAAEEETEETSAEGYFNEGDEITISDSVNIRESMSTDSDRIGTAYAGDTVTVVMSYSEGWTKVKWGNKTGFIRTDILLEQ